MDSHQILILLFIGYLVYTIDNKQKNFPAPLVLLLLGIALSFFPFFTNVHITKEIIFEWFLPALLFISAYQFPFTHLKKHAGIIAALSTVGLLLSALLLGTLLYAISGPFLSLSFVGALLIASILTPTDPVSVVSILKKASKDPKIADVVEGESMVNDGTSIVLYTVIASMYLDGERFSITSFSYDFILVSLGGIAIGALFGWIVCRAIYFTHQRQYQVMLSIVLAYGSFYVAEKLGVSGVLSVVAAGIILSYELDGFIKESHYREYLNSFWEVVEPSILALIFLLIGIETTNYLDFNNWAFAGIIFLSSVVVRFLVLTGIIKSFSSWRNEFNWKDISLVTWSGIRGTMSVALLLGLESEYGSANGTVISLAFGAVLLSLVFQSLTIYPLSSYFERKTGE
ncbi:cation:proton antiporter [Pseudalkalibacillus hwajinpoensis]|uniref:Sodium:proton antiporter n=1 Tax=Guptibacillus hwajinpoensis TaxID=208199 RepID=A0A4U1M6G8_9BACL|nr:sodium:proton antiporter [Pseudalkalibacillus hwajinpoensis]TKD65785.1 sodium:proton antiporter [Pseudalkalibacillus hwajinpoensis]